MTRVYRRKAGSEFLRLATLGILFAATMLAAVVVPRQVQMALQSARAAPSPVADTASFSSRASFAVRRHKVRKVSSEGEPILVRAD